jgi:hypothetical protein
MEDELEEDLITMLMNLSREPVAWMARYIDKDGNEAVYTTTVYELAVENDVNGTPIPLYM